jgi:poly-beta-1,6-N-acetyl-D-glucosamine synthase
MQYVVASAIALFWISLSIVVFANVGYLVVLALLSRLRIRPVAKDEAFTPSLSVIIPAYNEETIIDRKIQNTLALDYPADRMQVVVVSDGSTDGTNAVLGTLRDSRLRVEILKEGRGKCGALMVARTVARGDILVLTDADSMVETDALRKLARNFADPEVGGVVGRVVVRGHGNSNVSAGASSHWKLQEMLRRFETDLGSTVSAAGVLHAVRAPLFPCLSDSTCDDWHILLSVLQQGYRMVSEPAAIGTTCAPRGIRTEFCRKARIQARQLTTVQSLGMGLLRLRWTELLMLIGHKFCRWLVPWCLMAMLVSNAVLLWRPEYRILFAGQLLFYALAVLGFGCQLAGVKVRLLHAPFYFVMANTALAVGALRWALRGSASRWNLVHAADEVAGLRPPEPAPAACPERIVS